MEIFFSVFLEINALLFCIKKYNKFQIASYIKFQLSQKHKIVTYLTSFGVLGLTIC